MSDTLNFIALKALALSGRSKKEGKMLSEYLRLWYDQNNNTVKLIVRRNDAVLISTNLYDVTTMLANESTATYCNTNTIYELYGVHFSSIPKNSLLRNKHRYFIAVKEGNYVYIPKYTQIKNGIIHDIADYSEVNIDRSWNKEYTQTSKRNRAAFTAMHKMLPFIEPAKKNISQSTRIPVVIPLYSIELLDQQTILRIVMNTATPKPQDIYYIRKALGLQNPKYNLRTLLQKIINDYRYTQATKNGKVIFTKTRNLVR